MGGVEAAQDPVMDHLDPGRSRAFQFDACHQRIREHRQIRSIHVGIGVAAKNRQPSASAYPKIDGRRAALGFHHRAVLICEMGNAERRRSFAEGPDD